MHHLELFVNLHLLLYGLHLVQLRQHDLLRLQLLLLLLQLREHVRLVVAHLGRFGEEEEDGRC